jgi:hypothetical protein
MTTSDPRSVELEQLVPSYEWDALENDNQNLSEDAIRELSAYALDSDEQTMVGIGIAGSPSSSAAARFDSSDRTLVGIGPVQRAERAERARLERAQRAAFAELSSRPSSRKPEPEPEPGPEPESVRMPPSEPPGPFVAADDDDVGAGASPRVPMRKLGPWALALPAVLVAAAAIVVVRGGVPHLTAPHAAAPPLPAVAAAASAPLVAPLTLTPEVMAAASAPVAVQRDKPLEAEPTRALKKVDVAEPLLGSLDITSSPHSSLVLDGRPLGKAPRVVQVPPGSHTVVFVHPQRGRMTVTVNVRPGKTTTASADF